MTESVVALVLVLASTAPSLAASPEMERLRGENARLRARVEVLEKENARLRGPSRAATAAAAGRVHVEQSDGATLLLLERSRLAVTGARSRHWIGLRAERAADAASAPAEVIVEIEAGASGGVYGRARVLRLSADGESFSGRVVDHRQRPVTVGPSRRVVGRGERVRVAIPLAALDRIAAARDVHGTLGPTGFTLTAEQVAGFAAFRRRLDE